MSPNTIPSAASTSPPAAERWWVGWVDCSGGAGSSGAAEAALMAPFTAASPPVAGARAAVSAGRPGPARRDRSVGSGDAGDAVPGARGSAGGVDRRVLVAERPVRGRDQEAAGDLA